MTVLTLPANRRSARTVARAHADRALQLVSLLTEGAMIDRKPLAAAALRRVATCRSVSRREFALVPAVVEVCQPHADPQAAERLVLLLTDVDGWAESEVGEALGLRLDEVAQLRTSARARVGAERLARRECRGWGLVGRHSGRTTDETAAAEAHLGLCWSCRERLREQQRVRERLQTRSAAVTATVVADVVALTVPAGGATTAGLVGAAASKLAVAAVGAGALAVAVTSAGLAVARTHPNVPTPSRTQQLQNHGQQTAPDSRATDAVAPPAAHEGRAPATAGPEQPMRANPPLPVAPLPAPSAPLSAASLLPTDVQTLLPTSLPATLLPSALPTVVPTSIPTLPLSLTGTP